MTKPTEKELAEYMEAYSARAFELQEIRPFPVNWRLQSVEMLDYYESTCKPNGDWCMVSGKRISSWKRCAQRWVRKNIQRMADNEKKGGRPVSTYEPPMPKKQTPEAARAAIQAFLRGEA